MSNHYFQFWLYWIQIFNFGYWNWNCGHVDPNLKFCVCWTIVQLTPLDQSNLVSCCCDCFYVDDKNCLERSSPIFFVSGPHTPLGNVSSAEHLTWCDYFGIWILPNQQSFVSILFLHYLQNVYAPRWNGFAGGICHPGGSLKTPF